MSYSSSSIVKYSVVLCLGVILCVVGIILFPIFKDLIHTIVAKNVIIKCNSTMYADWVSPPAEVYTEYWFWDLKNKAEVHKGQKPYVEQKGPYAYREYLRKTNITFNDNGTVSFYHPTTFIFDPEKSCKGCTENDTFTSINILILYIATLLEKEPALIKIAADLALLLANEEMFHEHTVADILWGYEDPLLKVLKDWIHIDIPDGILSGANNSIESNGLYTIFTGENDLDKVNVFDNWNGSPNLTWWTTDEANMINGTDGSSFPPFLNKDKPLYLFSSDICRSVFLLFEKETSLKGVSLFRYTNPKVIFEPGTTYKPNEGFCTPDLDHCLPSGLLNISTCKRGIPIVISSPHFYNGDPSLVIGGMNPNKEEHQTFMDIDRITGFPLRLSIRLQINIYAKESDFILQTTGLASQYYPILWMNKSSTVTNDAMNKYKHLVILPLNLTKAAKYGFIVMGGLIIICVALTLSVKGCKRSISPPNEMIENDERSSLLGSQ